MNAARRARAALLGVATLVAADAARAQEAVPAAARGYSLLRPVPRERLRDLRTDRPDRTESPFTVDAGHWQVELDAVAWTGDDEGGRSVRETAVAALNLKLGLLPHLDVQLVVPLYSRVSAGPSAGPRTASAGPGDVAIRAKLNLRGNDGGRVAVGLMPFVSLPTARAALSAGAVEGGLIAPLAVDLGGGWGLGVMVELDVVRRAGGPGYHLDPVQSATVSRSLGGALGAYVELFTAVETEGRASLLATGDLGFTLAIGSNVQLDAGANLGLTRAAPGATFFLGFTARR